jgi:hypothetical protein
VSIRKEDLAAEQWRRALVSCTAAAIADGHEAQQRVLESDARSMVCLCARQVGKTWACAGLLWLTASRTANVECLYAALVKDQAKLVWRRYWKPLLRRWKIPHENLEGDLQTTFPNGSVVKFASVDDSAHIETFLGASRASGIVIIDECQSTPVDLQDLVERIIEPSLSQTSVGRETPGRLVMLGTIPEVPAGYFWQVFKRGLTAAGDAVDAFRDDGWTRFSWSRFDNPHLLDAHKHLAATLKKMDTTAENPIIQRDWFGRWVFDSTARSFHGFSEDRNSYVATSPVWLATTSFPPGTLLAAAASPDIDFLAIGIDPASLTDRFALVLWGWSTKRRIPATQLAEWVTANGADPLQSTWVQVVTFLLDKYGPTLPRYVCYDATGAQSVIDFTYRNTQMYIRPALKGPGSKKAGVDRMNDVFSQRQCMVIKGGALEEDLVKSKWSVLARNANKWEWASDWHPDVADAGRYGLEKFLQTAEPDKVDEYAHLAGDAKIIQQAAAEARQSFADMYSRGPEIASNRPRGATGSLFKR